MTRSKIPILNGQFESVTLKDTVEWARDFIARDQRGYICTVNVAILMMMRSDRRLQSFVNGAALVVADGQPLIWASRVQPNALPERVTGVDLVDVLCGLAAKEGHPVYFLGAKRSVIDTATNRLKARYPALQIAGVDDGYFGPEDAPQRADAIAKSGAKILIVGMGVPRQEIFLEEQWDRLGVNLAIPVGGSFEVFAGTAKRAPVVVQRVGMEWAFRLAQEPRRLWKRYLVTNSQFLFHLAMSKDVRDRFRRRRRR